MWKKMSEERGSLVESYQTGKAEKVETGEKSQFHGVCVDQVSLFSTTTFRSDRYVFVRHVGP